MTKGKTHGKRSTYATGCRCLDCVAVESAYRRRLRLVRRVSGFFVDKEHGVLSTYRAGCRCFECREENRYSSLGWRKWRGIFLDSPRTKHGHRGAYDLGCRCKDCRTGRNLEQKLARKTLPKNLLHGRLSSYTSGCRCKRCKRAVSTYRKTSSMTHGERSTFAAGCRCSRCIRVADLSFLSSSDISHGSSLAYRCGCRCEQCVAEHERALRVADCVQWAKSWQRLANEFGTKVELAIPEHGLDATADRKDPKDLVPPLSYAALTSEQLAQFRSEIASAIKAAA